MNIEKSFEFCVYCGRDGKTSDCTCKQARWDRSRNSKPLSARCKITKSFGRCPKCGSVITPMDTNQWLKVVCPSCGETEDYVKIKEGAWKGEPKSKPSCI